jgi:multimeric flavodoxin WrbA
MCPGEITRILCLACSPRRGGNTDFCARAVAEELGTFPGVSAQIVRLDDYDIRHCLGCRRCMELKDCVIRDDGFHELWARVVSAGVIVQVSPVYWLGPPGKHKDFIDRSHAFWAGGPVLAGKAGYTISVAADSGFDSHEACIESWLKWYGASVRGRLRIRAREADDAARSSAAVADLKSFARQIAQSDAE